MRFPRAFVNSTAVLAAAFSCSLPLAAGARPMRAADGIRWEPYETTGADGRPLAGELGRLRVPEDRAEPDGATVEIAFVRFRSTNPEPGPPIFFLAGGPGGSGVEGCVGPATGRMVRLIEYGDVIGIDQRGTGRSVPNLADAPEFTNELPLDRPVTREDTIRATRAAIGRMVAHWRERGVDPTAYDTAASADDVEAVRAALGEERIVLWGASYGTHLGLAYLRRHPGRTERAVLFRVEGPDHTFKLPSAVQARLEGLHRLVAADAEAARGVPDFMGSVRSLLARLAEEPVEIAVTARDGAPATIVCGPYDLQMALAGLLDTREGLGHAPLFVRGLLDGDWSILGELALDHRRGPLPSAMTLWMDCASGASAERRARIEREARDPANLLSDAMDGFHVTGCDDGGAGDAGDAFRGPLQSDARVLFVSGDLDARTPPANVEELRPGFPNGVHVLVRNAGHVSREFLSPEFRELLGEFLSGGEVADATIELPPIRFQPIATGG